MCRKEARSYKLPPIDISKLLYVFIMHLHMYLHNIKGQWFSVSNFANYCFILIFIKFRLRTKYPGFNELLAVFQTLKLNQLITFLWYSILHLLG